jgi:predicted secreted protein
MIIDAEKENQVKVGQEFSLYMKEEPGQGATWHLKDDFDHATADYLGSIWHGQDKGIAFNFRALKEGLVELHLAKRKYKDTLEVKHVNVKIVGATE